MYTLEQLEAMKRPELNPIAKELGLSTAVSIKNTDLIQMILEKQVDDSATQTDEFVDPELKEVAPDQATSAKQEVESIMSHMQHIEHALRNLHTHGISPMRIVAVRGMIKKMDKILSPLK